MINNKTFRIFRTSFWIIVAVSLLLGIFFIIFHFIYFHESPSKKLNDWADFGNFFAGTIGVILAALNFMVLTYITVKVNMRSDQQWLTQLRAPFYKEIIESLYNLKIDTDNEISDLNNYLKKTDFKNLLFLVEERERLEVKNRKDKLLSLISELYNYDSHKKVDKTIFKSHVADAKDELTNYLGKIMMNQTKDVNS